MKVIELKEEEFDEKVLKSDKLVLVDFFATWCGPCKMLSPVISELADHDDTYMYYKIDTDQALKIARNYGIMSIPTLIVFDKGNPIKKTMGYKSMDELKQFLELK